MRNIYMAALFLFWSASLVFGQTDSLKMEPSSGLSRSKKIAEGRQLLLDKFIEKDFDRVKVTKDYLISLDDEDYIALFPQEFWLLSFWTNEFEDILNTTKAFNRDSLNRGVKRIPPGDDYLAVKLIEKTKENEARLADNISKAGLTQQEKDFLRLHLKFLANTDKQTDAVQQELNELSDSFLERYSNSDYNQFVRSFIRKKYETSNTGGGYFFHGGKFLFTGNLAEYYTSPTLIGFSADLLKNNWLFQLNMDFGFGKTKKDMPVNGDTWAAGSKALGGHIDIAAGRYVLDNKIVGVAPFISVGVFGLDANDYSKTERPELKDAGIKTTIAGSLGFVTDFKLSTKIHNPSYYNFNNSERTTILRLTYGYIASPLKSKHIDYSGSVHKITLGIGVLNRNRKRVY